MTASFRRLSDIARAVLARVPSASPRRGHLAQPDDPPSTSAERFFGTLTDGPIFEAPERLRAPSLFTSEAGLRQHDRADWQHVDPRLQLFAARMIEAFRKRGIPLYVHWAFRTKDQQDALKAQGVSNALYPFAPHCLGCAVDIVHSRYHWELTKDEWAMLGKVGQQVADRMGLKVKWGGSWNFYDPAHWELSDWRTDWGAKYTRVKHIGEPVRLTPRGILAKYKGEK